MKTLVAGPPCGGKTTWAGEQAEAGELIVDFDAMLADKGYGYGEAPPAVVDQTYREWLARAASATFLVWTAPKRWQRGMYRRQGWATVVVMASFGECLDRATRERPPSWQRGIEQWFREYEPSRSGGDLIVWTGAEQ